MPNKPTAEERNLIAMIAAHESWAKTTDRPARTANARAALLAKFETEVDPEGTLSPDERVMRAESARKAHFHRLALKSGIARRKSAELAKEAARAEAELRALGEA